MSPTLSPTTKALAVFEATRSQSAWADLPAPQLATEARALIPGLQEALVGAQVMVRSVTTSQGVMVLTAPQLHRRYAVVGVILAKVVIHEIEPHDAYWQLMRELRTAIEQITMVSEQYA